MADRIATLEQRVELLVAEVERLTAKEGIVDVLNQFAHALDEHQWELYASLYAVDGEIVMPFSTLSGRAGIADFARQALGRFPALMHCSTNFDVQLVKNPSASAGPAYTSAHVKSKLASWYAYATGAPEHLANHFAEGGEYKWTMVYSEEEHAWKVKRVELKLVWTSGADAGLNDKWEEDSMKAVEV